MNPLRALLVSISRIPPPVMLAVIVGFAALAAISVNYRLSEIDRLRAMQIKELKDRADARARVVYMVQSVEANETITAAALEEKEVLRTEAPVDAVPAAAYAVGRVAKYALSAGQILSSHDLNSASRDDFSSRLRSGMRAVTFAVDGNSGMAGFVVPESRVDIMGIVGSDADTRVAAVLADVEVIACGQTYKRTGEGAVPANSVTVAVTPGDAQRLIKAVAASKLYLALRTDGDRRPLATTDITTLYPVAVALPTPAASPPDVRLAAAPTITPAAEQLAPVDEVEVWSGSRKDVVSFPAR